MSTCFSNENKEGVKGSYFCHNGIKYIGRATDNGFSGEVEKGCFKTFESEKEWVRYMFEKNPITKR